MGLGPPPPPPPLYSIDTAHTETQLQGVRLNQKHCPQREKKNSETKKNCVAAVEQAGPGRPDTSAGPETSAVNVAELCGSASPGVGAVLDSNNTRAA